MFHSEIKTIDINDVVTNDENVPFALSTAPDDEVVFLNNATVQNERELQSVATVTITNHCMEQAFWLAIRYREERTGNYVHKGWYNVPSRHQVSFYDVVDGEYSMFALSHDYRFKWGGDPSTASFCVNGYCYQDFQTSGSNSFQYLSCYSGGPSPTPAPVPSPTNYPLTLSYREKQWVDAHNTRRATIHTQFGKSFKPLQWSAKLADSAQGYADLLATVNFETCYIAHGYQGNSYGGENLACDWGSSDYYFESPDAVLKRWFEDEENEPWPANGVSMDFLSINATYSHGSTYLLLLFDCSSIEHKLHGEVQVLSAVGRLESSTTEISTAKSKYVAILHQEIVT